MGTSRGDKPPPYVSLYMARGTAEAALRALRWHADGHSKSNPLWRAVRQFEEVLNDGEVLSDDTEANR